MINLEDVRTLEAQGKAAQAGRKPKEPIEPARVTAPLDAFITDFQRECQETRQLFHPHAPVRVGPFLNLAPGDAQMPLSFTDRRSCPKVEMRYSNGPMLRRLGWDCAINRVRREGRLILKDGHGCLCGQKHYAVWYGPLEELREVKMPANIMVAPRQKAESRSMVSEGRLDRDATEE